jgi:activator of HSP90 ATPase
MATRKAGTKSRSIKSTEGGNRKLKDHVTQKVKTIRQKQYFATTPEEVYEALTNSRRHAAFTGAKATGAAKVGGKFTAWDGFISGKHIKLEPGRYIQQEWKTSRWPKNAPPSMLEFTLQKKGNGTQLTMIQSLVPAEQVEHYRKGWFKSYWRPLKSYFAKSRD